MSRHIVDHLYPTTSLEVDLKASPEIVAKCRASMRYSQNLYAAMCNNQFTKNDIWPILKEEHWTTSWRSAGGIVAELRGEGVYIDWYCSGIKNEIVDFNMDGEADVIRDPLTDGYVEESHVTDEIRADLLKLGWICQPYPD